MNTRQLSPHDMMQLRRRLELHELFSRGAGSLTLNFSDAREVVTGRALDYSELDPRQVVLLEDELRPHSNLLRSGVTFIDFGQNLQAVALPTLDPEIVAGWGTSQEIQPGLEDVPLLRPHRVVAHTILSKQLILMSPAAGMPLVEKQLYSALAGAIERSVFRGNGIDGDLVGMMIDPKIERLEEPPSVANIAASERRIAEAYLEDAFGVFVSPETRERFRTTSGTDQPIWNAAIPQSVSPHLSGDTAVAGSWSQLFIASWGGVQVTLNPYKHDIEGFVSVMIESFVDWDTPRPSAFSVISAGPLD